MPATTISPGIRRIALEQFTARRAALQKAATEGSDWAGDPANENARLWLAIALASGAGPDLPADIRSQIEVECLWPAGKRILPRADQIAQPHAYLGELARARDVAITRAEAKPEDLRADQRARDLIELAKALGAPGMDFTPKDERKVA